MNNTDGRIIRNVAIEDHHHDNNHDDEVATTMITSDKKESSSKNKANIPHTNDTTSCNNDDNNNNNNNNNKAITMQAVTKLFAQQNLHDVPSAVFRQVSSNHREESLYEVHGVLKPIEETPELVQERITKLASHLSSVYHHLTSTSSTTTTDDPALDNRLDGMPPSVSPGAGGGITTSKIKYPAAPPPNQAVCDAYDAAMHASPDFMKRLMLCCLRADGFHVEKAATRFLHIVEAKSSLFGAESVGRELEVTDLNGPARQALEDGGTQLLKTRDRSGRVLLAHFNGIARKYPVDALGKLLIWSISMAARDEEVQKRGFVYIMCSLDDQPPPLDRTRPLVHYLSCLPVRLAAFHFCTSDVARRKTITEAIRHFDVELICRFNSHFGTPLEFRNNLMAFGVPLNALPVRNDATINLKPHTEWVASLLLDEESSSRQSNDDVMDEADSTDGASSPPPGCSTAVVEPPKACDVVFGRGTRWIKHAGNVNLKRLLEERRADFDTVRRKLQTAIVKDVYTTVRANGGRFLLLSPAATWLEIGERQALDRISHGFRNLRLASKK